MSLLADSTVLVDLWRLRRQPARLDALGRILSAGDRFVPWMVFFEFARGHFVKGRSEHAVRDFLADFDFLPISEPQVVRAARIAAELQRGGETIGFSDVWIAAALEENLPVLTRNSAHFTRIPGI